MTAAAFRRLALSMPAATEVGHMGHPDFRVGGKIFATLGYPDAAWGVVPVKGGWGRMGATNVCLAKRLADADSKR